MAKFYVRVMENGEWGDEEVWEYDTDAEGITDMVQHAVKQDTGEYPDSVEVWEVV